METMEKVTTKGEFLFNKNVLVKPVEAGSKWTGLLSKGEERRKEPFLFNKCSRRYDAPLASTGGIATILDNTKTKVTTQYPNEELTEQQFFEKILGLPKDALNPHSADTFWKRDPRGKVKISKEGLRLNLSSPLDMIKYRILKANSHKIAQSYETRFDGSYEFYFESEGKEVSKRVEQATVLSQAWTRYTEVTRSIESMKDLLRSRGLSFPGKVTEDWLKSEISKMLETDPNGFLNMFNDEFFEDKVFINKAVEARALKKLGKDRFALDNGIELGDLIGTVKYFRDPENNSAKLRVQALIEIKNRE